MFALSALTLLVLHQEEHPACKNWVMRCWCGCLCVVGMRYRLLAYGPADATAIPKPYHLLPQFNPDWFCLSGTRLHGLCWKKRPSNGCNGSSFLLYHVLSRHSAGLSIIISNQLHLATDTDRSPHQHLITQKFLQTGALPDAKPTLSQYWMQNSHMRLMNSWETVTW